MEGFFARWKTILQAAASKSYDFHCFHKDTLIKNGDESRLYMKLRKLYVTRIW